MRADLDHLPHRQQHELERIRTTLLTEFEAAINSGGGGTQSWRRDGKVLKIILFGSYARTDWVDEPDMCAGRRAFPSVNRRLKGTPYRRAIGTPF